MNPKVKKTWVAALRSGEYKQGRNYLRNGDNYCCLGVLCEVAVQKRRIPPAVISRTNTSIYSYSDYSGTPPSSVSAWSDLPSYVASHLIDMNDREASFEEIADWIEANL